MQTRRIAPAILLLAVLAAIPGCTTTTPPVQPNPDIELPGQWTSNPPESSPHTAWLDDFKDPALNEMVAEALTRNANLQAAAARLPKPLPRLV